MGRKEYDELENMHGLIKIRFDQSELAFPFFLLSAQYKECSTLAPFMTGAEYFTRPHVRMGWDYGVAIELHDCEFTKKSFEPYEKYMSMFEVQKMKLTGRSRRRRS